MEKTNTIASFFRQVSLDHLSSPEQTDDYVRLPVASRWLVAVFTSGRGRNLAGGWRWIDGFPEGEGMRKIEKAPVRVSSPKELNRYIRVFTPAVWIAMAVIIVLLCIIGIWSVFCTVDAVDATGRVESVHPTLYVMN